MRIILPQTIAQSEQTAFTSVATKILHQHDVAADWILLSENSTELRNGRVLFREESVAQFGSREKEFKVEAHCNGVNERASTSLD